MNGVHGEIGVAKVNKKVRTVFQIAVCLLIVGVTIALLYGKATGKHVIPYMPVWVMTGSMEPTIDKESYILVAYTDSEHVNVDDIITFISPDPSLQGAYNTHRVVEIIGDGEAFITKGDAASEPDSVPVPALSIVAKYVKDLPILTFLGRVYASPAGLAAIIIFFLFFCFMWTTFYLRGLAENKKKEEMDRRVAEEVARMMAEDKEHHRR